MSITLKELNELRKKYTSSPHILLLTSDDAGPLYFLKGGKEDNVKVLGLYQDLHRLIQELELLLKQRG